jgi:N-sulfoglucosamine sulfohydrolase
MKQSILTSFLACLTLSAQAAGGGGLPNILWITSEDNTSNWLGCYGSSEAATPRLDALAQQSLRFTRAYSNGPVCAVARSVILTGAHAATLGTGNMRSRHPIPQEFKPYVTYFREKGYYCTNNLKTDYNFKGDDAALWDECSGQAHYKKRPDGKPFFAVFNLILSHESMLFPPKIAANRAKGVIPAVPRLDPSKVIPPPYLPDLPEIRSDIAVYHDMITAMDTQVGALLDELRDAGLAEDTIVFYYSDHGGAVPRGKRYLEDTGVRVPLIIHIPEKWRSLSPFKSAQVVDELVAFVDLAPTVLSLVGLEKPVQMQGRAFLGPKRVEPPEDNIALLYADRFEGFYGMRRGLTDGRWKYIRCFTPHLPGAPYSDYALGQAGWAAWQKAWKQGKLDPRFAQIWDVPQPVELLFDTANDPMENNDLAADPAHAGRLAAMRERLRTQMIAVVDTGLVPEPMYEALAPNQPIATYLASRRADLPALVTLTFAASSGDKNNLPEFIKKLASPDPVTRYWASQGCLILGKAAAPAADALVTCLRDEHSTVRISAAHALFVIGRPEGKTVLLEEFQRNKDKVEKLTLARTLGQIGLLADEPAPKEKLE